MGAPIHTVMQISRSSVVLRGVVICVVCLGLLLPIGAGLWQTTGAAFGMLPAIGATEFSLRPFAALWDIPGIATGLKVSIVTGLGATALSLVVAAGFASPLHQHVSRGFGARVITLFLAMPHAALAIGLVFVFAPSGWIARVVAFMFGWGTPPNVASVNDPWGVALMIGLMIKEVPFLLLMILSALTQIPVQAQQRAGQALGYSRAAVWVKIILPQIWPLIRLPVIVVLAYSISVVDMAMILGPTTPPSFAVILTRLFSDPDLTNILLGSAGGLVQLGLVAIAAAMLWCCVHALRFLGVMWIRQGARGASCEVFIKLASASALILFIFGFLAIVAIGVWSVTWRWSWPAMMPESWSLRPWQSPTAGWADALWSTLTIALSSTLICLVLAVAWLESEDRMQSSRARWGDLFIYLPLLVPQVSFLFGMNVLLIQMGLSGRYGAVIWAHCLFVFPYVMIALRDPWRARDRRLDRAAASLGAGPWRRLYRVKLPVLLAPLCASAAIGIAVSVAQYLPTLFMGAGRVATLTTEAVTLASSSDRRVVGVYASLQATVPFVAYLAAFLTPAFVHRHRRTLTGGAHL